MIEKLGGTKLEQTSYSQKENYIHDITPKQRAGHIYIVILKEMEHFIKGKTVLHIGCNSGSTTYHINKLQPKELSGLDINVKALVRAKCVNPELKFYHSCITNMYSVKDNSVDTIVLFDIFEHIYTKDKEKALSEMKRILKNKGVILLSVPRAVKGSIDEEKEFSAFDPSHVSFYYQSHKVLDEFKDFECIKFYNETRTNPGDSNKHNSWVGVFRCVH